jgi:uncharacterized protein (TIGR02145 family)
MPHLMKPLRTMALFLALPLALALSSYEVALWPVPAGPVQIGEQTWMDRNMDVEKFRNGDRIPQAKSAAEWLQAGEAGQPAWCYYEFDAAKGDTYGKLYNWHAVTDKRGLAPSGWRVPSDADWVKLLEHLEGESLAGAQLKSTSGWSDEGNGTNESGFGALPGGGLEGESFNYMGQFGMWWSTTPENDVAAWMLILESGSRVASRSTSAKIHGFSVRYVKE